MNSTFEAHIEIQGGITSIAVDEVVGGGTRTYGVSTGALNDSPEFDVKRLDGWLRSQGWRRIGQPERTHRTSVVEYWRAPVERLEV